MKVRTDYVTNSSSSSFIIVSKISKRQELLEYMKEEYGKYGLRLLNEYLVKGIIDGDGCLAGHYIPSDIATELDPSADYLIANYYEWPTEGDTEGDDAWLNNHIPSEFKDEVCRIDDYY